MSNESQATMQGSDEEQAYTAIEHTADIALRVRGRSMEELFANAARGMFAQMVDLRQVPVQVQRHITLGGDVPEDAALDDETLLVAWLSELLYLRETKGEAYTRFTVSFPAAGRLQGTAEGGPWQAFDRPVKAVTFHRLRIERQGDIVQATIVFDV